MNIRKLVRILKEENQIQDQIELSGLKPFKTSDSANAGYVWTVLNNDLADQNARLHPDVFRALPPDRNMNIYKMATVIRRRAQMVYNTEAEAFAALASALKKVDSGEI